MRVILGDIVIELVVPFLQDPKKRATADAILQHGWMKENGTASDRPLDNVIVKRMQGFLHMNKLKKEALKVMATGMSPEEIAGLRSLFQVSEEQTTSEDNVATCPCGIQREM